MSVTSTILASNDSSNFICIVSTWRFHVIKDDV